MLNLQSRQSHLKKCAQEFNVGTNQLLEIVNREKQQEESTSSAVRTEVNTALSTNVQAARNLTGVKRKRRGVTHERYESAKQYLCVRFFFCSTSYFIQFFSACVQCTCVCTGVNACI